MRISFIILALAGLSACGRTAPIAPAQTLTRFPDAGAELATLPDASTGSPDASVPSCADDEYEENDSLSAAAFHWRGGPAELVSCPEDIDVIQGHSDCCYDVHQTLVGATIEWNPSEGALQIQLLDAQGRAVAAESGDEVVEEPGRVVRRHSTLSGYFFVQVTPVGDRRVPYRVTLHYIHFL